MHEFQLYRHPTCVAIFLQCISNLLRTADGTDSCRREPSPPVTSYIPSNVRKELSTQINLNLKILWHEKVSVFSKKALSQQVLRWQSQLRSYQKSIRYTMEYMSMFQLCEQITAGQKPLDVWTVSNSTGHFIKSTLPTDRWMGNNKNLASQTFESTSLMLSPLSKPCVMQLIWGDDHEGCGCRMSWPVLVLLTASSSSTINKRTALTYRFLGTKSTAITSSFFTAAILIPKLSKLQFRLNFTTMWQTINFHTLNIYYSVFPETPRQAQEPMQSGYESPKRPSIIISFTYPLCKCRLFKCYIWDENVFYSWGDATWQ